MFFVLSKVLYFLLVPFWWIVILLVWMWRTRSPRRKRNLLIVAIVLVVVFTNPFIYRSLVLNWQPDLVEVSSDKKYDAGILLGGLAGYDRFGRGFFSDESDRFIQAANLFHRGIIKKIIVTGGVGGLYQKGQPEATFLNQALIKNGIPDSCIITESKSRNTFENAVFSKRIVDSLHIKGPYVLITSALHMRRSHAVFTKAGFDIIEAPADFKVVFRNNGLDETLIPDVSLLKEWSYFLKEIIGLYVYRMTGKA